MDEIEQPELRGEDKRGNVRPADDRFLTKAQQRKRNAYVTKVEEAQADADASRDETPKDPTGDVLRDAVRRALVQGPAPEVDPEPAPEVDPDQPALPTGDDA